MPVYTVIESTLPVPAVGNKVTKLVSDFASTHEGSTVSLVVSADVETSQISSNVPKLIVSAKGVSNVGPSHNLLMSALRELETNLEEMVLKFYEHLDGCHDSFDLKDDTDRTFINEMVVLRNFFDYIEDHAKSITTDDTPDMYTFVITGLERLSTKYGPQSEQFSVAKNIVHKTLSKTTRLFKHIYTNRGVVELVTVTTVQSATEISHRLGKRAVVTNGTLAVPNAGIGWGTNGFNANPVIAGYQNCAPTAEICQAALVVAFVSRQPKLSRTQQTLMSKSVRSRLAMFAIAPAPAFSQMTVPSILATGTSITLPGRLVSMRTYRSTFTSSSGAL
ncbi:Renin receptor [Gonapodya sp. JEL0774]|nr:Renin receptor [Gonapodya sp. JEL0774]